LCTVCYCTFVRMRVCYNWSQAGALIGVVVNRVVFDSGQVPRVTPGLGQQWRYYRDQEQDSH